MACDLGIPVTESNDFYFISYNSEDAERIAPIVQMLDKNNIPMWYDRGINYGDLWEETIANHIDNCKAVLLFFTKQILTKSESYVSIEYEMAKNFFKKEIHVIFLDEIEPDQVPHSKIRWMIELNRLQSIHYHSYPNTELFFNELLRIVDSYFTQLLRKADAGDVFAQFEIGRCHYDGIGAEQSYSKAVYWFEKAALQGYANAQHNLALCYESGIGIETNYILAFHWYEKAARQEHATAQNHLGLCYDLGIGVEKDTKNAIYWYKKSAMNGYPGGQYNLGISFLHGDGIEQDLDQAILWLTLADENGESRAKRALLICELLKDTSLADIEQITESEKQELFITIPKGKLA